MEKTIRDVINKLKWDARFRGDAYVYFVHRQDHSITLAKCGIRDITYVTKYYFSCHSGTEVKYIPLHRVARITYMGRDIWVSRRWVKELEHAA